ncbi:hypothetical protein Agub_g2705 [Astrephomene gubernaculifera]|uniref:Glycosyltransferase family 31 protein n=1 Tax=Astrephomene gubernaculifera TaxID=47775 RepID=A0AAD3HIH6_9CHLO|nr:hypothetical protein Agub_g2705 [Astrephomene gubernaculifera]
MALTRLYLLASLLATAISFRAAHATIPEGSAQELADDDFVVAISTASSRLVLAQGTRAYRAGIRTFIMNSNETEIPFLNKVYAKYRETYEYFPDEEDPDPKRWHAKNPGDFRAAMAPFAAHRHFGNTYKWMLYGDDDTLFFMRGVQQLLSNFDPELPLALSDNLWYETGHPRLESFRCLPCGFNTSNMPAAQTDTGYTPRAACPYCTRKDACPPSKPSCAITGAHGGAGMIFSVGLMRQLDLSYDAALACMNDLRHCSGGDCLVSQCLWRAGYGFTDPGFSLQYTQPYDHVLFDNMEARWFLKSPIESITMGNCGPLCRNVIQHAVSYHVRGKSFPSFAKAAAFMYGLTESYGAAIEFLALQADRGSRGVAAAVGGEEEGGEGGAGGGTNGDGLWEAEEEEGKGTDL